MEIIDNKTFDMERALYGSHDIIVKNCRFDGPADGESAFKECRNIEAENCYFNLRYPFWHDRGLKITGSDMTELCRAALWYSDHIEIAGTKMHGIKALRECSHIVIRDCDIVSPEFGWSASGVEMEDTSAQSEYFMMRSDHLVFRNVKLRGKYSFQYTKDLKISHSVLNTKDAFWHAEHVIVEDSVINGEYLGWYSEGLTLIRCRIKGTQPLCYCKNLKLIDCTTEDCDLAFEYSDVEADIKGGILSVKNPVSGKITADEIGNIVITDDSVYPVKAVIKTR